MSRARGKGITILIDGDYNPLRQSLNQIKEDSKGAGLAIAQAMKSGVSYRQASANIDALAASMVRVKSNVQALDTDFKKAESQLNAVAKAAGVSEKQFAGLARQMAQKTNLDNLQNNLDRIQRLTGASALQMAKLRAEAGDVEGAFKGMARAASDGLGSIVNLKNAIMAGVVGLGFREFANITSVMTDLESRARIASGGLADTGAIMDRLREIADRAYSPLEATANAFMNNSTALNSLGLSMEKQLDLTDALTNALVVSGAKGQQFEMVMDAVNRSLATGKMGSRELDTVLKYGGAAAEVLAQHLGTTVTKLRQFAKDGKLTADVIADALIKNMDALRAKADAMPATINDAMVKFGNSLKMAVGDLDKSLGHSGGVVKAIDFAGAHLKDLAKAVEVVASHADLLAIAFGSRVAVGLGKSAAAFGKTTWEVARFTGATKQNALASLEEALAARAAAAAKVQNAASSNQLAVAQNALAVANARVAATAAPLTRATAAMSALRAAGSGVLGLFGGAWGLAFTVAAGGLYAFYQRSKAAEEAMARLAQKTEEAGEAIARTAAAAGQLAKIQVENEIAALEKELETAAGVFIKAEQELRATQYAMGHSRYVTLEGEASVVAQIMSDFYRQVVDAETALQRLAEAEAKFGRTEGIKKANEATITYNDSLLKMEKLQGRAASAMDDAANAAAVAATAHYDLAAAMREVQGVGSSETNTLPGAIKALDQLTANTKAGIERQKEFKKQTLEASLATLQAAVFQAEAAGDFAKMAENQRIYNEYLKAGNEALANNFEAIKRGAGASREAARQAALETKNVQTLVQFYDKLRGSLPLAADKYHELNQVMIENEIAALRAAGAVEEALKAYRKLLELEAATDAMSGLNRAMDDYTKANTAAAKAGQMFNRTADAMTDAFTDIVTGSKNAAQAFGDMAKSIVNELARIAVQMTITLPLVQALQSALGFGVAAGVAGGAAGAGASGGAQHGTAALAASGAIKPSALGNIFDSSGGIHKYVNTVVNKPTVFPFAKGGIFDPPPYGINRFAKGIGLMGEAGAEAVMPLERDSRGRLGVSVADDYIPGAGAAPRVNITINNQSGPPLRAEQQSAHQAPDGSWDFDVLVKTLEERMASRMNTRQSKLSPTMEGLYPGLARERAKAGMYR